MACTEQDAVSPNGAHAWAWEVPSEVSRTSRTTSLSVIVLGETPIVVMPCPIDKVDFKVVETCMMSSFSAKRLSVKAFVKGLNFEIAMTVWMICFKWFARLVKLGRPPSLSSSLSIAFSKISCAASRKTRSIGSIASTSWQTGKAPSSTRLSSSGSGFPPFCLILQRMLPNASTSPESPCAIASISSDRVRVRLLAKRCAFSCMY
mmetsp:Transcript_79518/g.174410  ORF Transcript_79518/g.174410 Transcript_79518/m.174410 type:complete len:205 (+) Transcript_79518:956-1570(+)